MTPRLAVFPLLIYVAAFVLGVVLSLALAPRHWLWAVPLTLMFLTVVLGRIDSSFRWAMTGWAFGLGYFALGLAWILEPFQVDPEQHAWMAPFALVFLAGGLALFWAAAFWAAARFQREGWSQVVALSLFWTLAEICRAYIFTGLPWAGFAQFWIDTPVASLLAWVGPHGVGFLSVFSGLALGLLLKRQTTPVRRIAGVIPAVVLAFLSWIAASGDTPDVTDKTIRLIQPNAPQHQKWDPEFTATFYQRSLQLTSAPATGSPPDVIVWPETSVPVLLESAGELLAEISHAGGGVPVLVGFQSSPDGNYYNSLVQIGPGGSQGAVYNKHHLVPFGEYLPFARLFSKLGVSGLASQLAGGFTPGAGAEPMSVSGIGKILPLICYEAVFPQDIRAAVERVDVLVQVTNDAWFGTYSGPYQHLVQARMRAIEQGLPLIRAANTGVSAVIDARGQISHMLPLGVAGYLDARLPGTLPPTMYAKFGDWSVFVFVVLGLMVLMLGHTLRPDHDQDPD